MMKSIDGLFWAAQLEESPDFSPEDPLALDYLAQQIGLWLFPGFTSRTTRAGYYPMVLYGLTLCEEAARHYGISRRERPIHDLFERWEKFWALAITYFHDGDVPKEDVMRGVRGITREFEKMGSRLHLDYQLMVRQLELGALGAYLSSLRYYRLVEMGGLRPTPIGRDFAADFWFGKKDNKHRSSYHSYAFNAINPGLKRVPEKYSNLRLDTIGKAACLSCIRDRKEMRDELWRILFKENRDGTTMPLARVLIEASRNKVTDSKSILGGILDGKWRASIEPELKETVKLAYHYGEVMASIRFMFDDIFKTIVEQGYVVDIGEIAAQWFTPQRLNRLRKRLKSMMKCSNFTKLSRLPMHGAAFVKFVRQVEAKEPVEIVHELVTLHDSIQRERVRGRGWIQVNDNKLVVELTAYRAWRESDDEWINDFKINPVRSILHDLGKIK